MREIEHREAVALSHAGNPHIRDVIAARLSRRAALLGISAAALATALPLGRVAAQASAPDFRSLPLQLDDRHHVAEGYRADVLIRWGDPVLLDAPAFDVARQSAASQAAQFGYNNDFLAFLPLPTRSRESRHGLLWVNHEYTNPELMRPSIVKRGDAVATATHEWVAVEMAAHGGSVLEIRRDRARWEVVGESRYNRRITATTPMRIAGPAAGHPRLRTAADPSGTRVLGMLNNCAGGKTPWGTVLSGEENFNNYFISGAADSPEAGNAARLGIRPAANGERYAWPRFEARFDGAHEPHEANRFGWIVEIDPYDPASRPVKRTALGRFKHEGASCAISSGGRIAIYSGDDQAGEYLYRFVTTGRFDPANPGAARDLLDTGELAVARFDADGMVHWLPLVHGSGKLDATNGFASQADVLIEARRAADLLGATRLDRPEDVEVSPVSGRVYSALTHNAERGKRWPVDAANPRANNQHGHILEIIPPAGADGLADHAAASARWEIFLLAGDPAAGARYHAAQGASGVWLSRPDNLAFDPSGRMYIATDQGALQRATGVADGLYVCAPEGEKRALISLLFAAPIGAEVCGPELTPDGRTLFVAVQHPGEGSTSAQPSTRWPDFRDGIPPRPAVLAITREDGGEIGA
jgi:secreted PhoX family phosphatase